MSVLLWYTASDYPCNIFKLLYHDRPILLTIVLNTSMFVDSWCFRTDATNGVVESSRHRCNWNGVSMWESCYNFRKGIVIYIYFNTVLLRVIVIIFNAHFNNMSVISWWSVSLVEETGVSKENHRPATSHWQTLSQNVVSSTHHSFSSERHWLDK